MGFADLHIHTTYSLDAVSSVSGVLKFAAHHTKLGVIAITDHNKIDGALEAVQLAPAYGIEVIPGMEVSSQEGHILALFISREISTGLSLERTVLSVLEQGGLCIIPHPKPNSRLGVSPYAIQRALQNHEVAQGLLGVEFFNAGFDPSRRDVNKFLTDCQLPVAQVGCSDAHVDWMVGQGATYFPGSSAADLQLALKRRETQVCVGRQINLAGYFLKYIPRLILRYAGWISWNATPSAPLRLVWSGIRGRRLKLLQTQVNTEPTI